ncbi:MAG TPA: shikimate dehydrogenase [Pyrinomonadaceae bacterium]|jgi:3-dehydroquinate dehydratase/shikimate dehydrogenase
MKETQAKPLICVPVCERSAGDLPGAIARAAELADIIELRLDYLAVAELDRALGQLNTLTGGTTRPFIITLRPAEQGGMREIDSLNRIVFWLDCLGRDEAPNLLYDIEFDVARVLMEKEGLDWNRIICSHHDFAGGQSNPEQLYQMMKGTPARIIKIAVRAGDATDCLPVFNLMERARLEGRQLIAVAMGEAGIVTRIMGPSRGSFLTYGALDKAHATAAGQSTAEELRELYRVQSITKETTVSGIMGSPVSHSVSPQMHNAALAASGSDAVYIPFEVLDAGSFLKRMAHPRSRELDWKLRGLSVTAPHKISVMEHLDWIEPAAREIGAVNTIIVEGEELHGYNTDAVGFLSPLVKTCGVLSGKEVAIIGAGGAARSALWSLKRAGAKPALFARDREKGERLAEEFGARSLELEGAGFRDFEIVVNATPLGTFGSSEDETPAIASQLKGARLAYDLIYNPRRTRFLLEAEKAGCETLTGLEMLIAQAAEQFRLWMKTDAPLEVMRAAATVALERQD